MSRPRTRILGPILIVAALVAGLGAAAYLFAPGPGAKPADEGRAALAREDFRGARSWATGILLKSPGDRSAMQVMARASVGLGDDDTASRYFGWIGEGAMEADDYLALATSLDRRGQGDAALAVMERARKFDPGHAPTLHALARRYAQADRLVDAIAAARALAGCPGWEARGGLILGVLDVENADAAGASAALAAALKADPALVGGLATPAKARKLLAGSLLRTAKPAKALDALGPVLAAGADPEASWLSAWAFLQAEDVPRARAALDLAGDFGQDDPTRAGPAPYVGSAACAGCHSAIYASQRAGRHARTFSSAADLKDVSLPAGPVADPTLPGTSHTLRREGDAIHLRTRTLERELDAVIELAVGSGDRGMTMVARDGAGLARVCRISSYLGGTLWDGTSHAADPHRDDGGGPLGRPMAAGATEKCVACHVTSLRAARDRDVPEAADRGIGCERCHGPGGNHLLAVKYRFPDPAIARPSRASAAQITQLCGACHKADDPSTAETDPRFVRFQATTLPMSRCYTESRGALSCVTCHDPHRDADTAPASYEARCLSCHSSSGPEPARGDRHSRLAAEIRRVPCPVSPAGDCVKCHMPKVEGAAPHASFTDHQIRARREAASAE